MCSHVMLLALVKRAASDLASKNPSSPGDRRSYRWMNTREEGYPQCTPSGVSRSFIVLRSAANSFVVISRCSSSYPQNLVDAVSLVVETVRLTVQSNYLRIPDFQTEVSDGAGHDRPGGFLQATEIDRSYLH